ncbi:MAG TPA: hypothetical protein VFI11_08465 [Anaerolineales bacterium]|nr:hypothetical protein [Anaerolineales bacterium]
MPTLWESENAMDWTYYFAPLVKWWKLIRLAALVAGASTLLATIGQRPVYESRTTLMIGQSFNNPNPSTSQFYLEQDLAKFYADMGRREPVRKAAAEALGLTGMPDYTVTALPNTQIVEIVVRDTDPYRAQAVAAELARQLVLRTPTSVNPEDQERELFVDDQLTRLQADISTTQEEIQNLTAQLGGLSGAREIADYERQISALDDKLRTLQGTYASLVSGTPRGAVNTLTILEPANLPTRSGGTNRPLTVLLGMLMGTGLAAGGAYLVELLDRRLGHPHEVTRLLSWPIVGEIENIPAEENPAGYVEEHPDTRIAASFRSLRTSLELAGMGDSIKTVLVTGPSVSEGKSTVALNLALATATPDRRVVLIDGDFHRPRLTYPDRKGFSDLLQEGGSATDYLISPYRGRLYILPAGLAPSTAVGMFSKPYLLKILADLQAVSDVIIIDGPPTFVPDTLALASKVDGLITVVRLDRTPVEAIQRMKTQLQSVPVAVLGVVVNGVVGRPTYYDAYYSRSAPVRLPETPDEVMQGMRGQILGIGSAFLARLRRMRSRGQRRVAPREAKGDQPARVEPQA